MAETTVTLSGLFESGAFEGWTKEQQAEINRRAQRGMQGARPDTDRVLRQETERAFDFSRKGAGKLRKSWRVNVYADRGPPKMIAKNLAKWFVIHTRGGVIKPRNTPRSLLIPINTAGGTRLGTKKFYKMIDWLRQEKMTIIKDGVLYVKPPMNTSRRGGVGVGTRVNKGFRSRFSGTFKRPTGFDIKLNPDGLTPIAIIRSSITMKRRFDLKNVADRKLVPIVAQRVREALAGRV